MQEVSLLEQDTPVPLLFTWLWLSHTISYYFIWRTFLCIGSQNHKASEQAFYLWMLQASGVCVMKICCRFWTYNLNVYKKVHQRFLWWTEATQQGWDGSLFPSSSLRPSRSCWLKIEFVLNGFLETNSRLKLREGSLSSGRAPVWHVEVPKFNPSISS